MKAMEGMYKKHTWYFVWSLEMKMQAFIIINFRCLALFLGPRKISV